jgi:hypothetical protein
MPQGKGTYGKKVGRPAKKKAKMGRLVMPPEHTKKSVAKASENESLGNQNYLPINQ